MSKCISREGEYSDHVTGEAGTPVEFICERCFAFDEDLATDVVHELRAELTRLTSPGQEAAS